LLKEFMQAYIAGARDRSAYCGYRRRESALSSVSSRFARLLKILVLLSATPGHLSAQDLPLAGVLTQRYSNARTGANLKEHVLTVASVSSTSFQKLYTIPVSGQVYAQPLLVPQVSWSDGAKKDVLIVATMQNFLYAFSVDNAVLGRAFSPVLLWSAKLGQPVPGDFMPMAYSTQTCVLLICAPDAKAPSTPAPLPPVGTEGPGLYNINPDVGIVSTPAADAESLTVYVVCKSLTNSGEIENRLFSIDLLTGHVIHSTAIAASVTGSSSDASNGEVHFDARQQMQRPALLLQNHQLYLAFGSHQDTAPWHGWVLRYDADTLNQTAVWCSTPKGMGGAIWQAGSGIAGDAGGNVYVMTGNGEQDPPGGPDNSSDTSMGNFADMFVQMSGDLRVLGSVAPPDEAKRETQDIDLGSAGPVLVPGDHVLVGGDKEGQIFVLDTTPSLRQTQSFQASALPSCWVSWHHIHGSPVLWRNSQNILNLYIWPERDYLRVFDWNDSKRAFDCRTSSGMTETCKDGDLPDQMSQLKAPESFPDCLPSMPGGILSVSSDENTQGTGVLWASIPAKDNGLNNVVSGVLHAFNAEDVTSELWNSDWHQARDGAFMFAKFTPPVVANGRVYLATFGSIPADGKQTLTGGVNVYGLTQWAKFVSATVPQSLEKGTTFTAQLTFLNLGTGVWRKGLDKLALAAGENHGIWGASQFDIPGDVNPGEPVTISLPLTAPAFVGTYAFRWQMVGEDGTGFGDVTALQIKVVDTTAQTHSH
jgi:hypothetical protein